MYRIGDEETRAVAAVIENGMLFRYGDPTAGHLNEVVNFEREWGAFTGAKYVVATTSGSASLVCALVGMGIGPGDEVAIPGYTYIATALCVLKVGAIPLIVDIDESCTMSAEALRKAIGPRTKAVIPVHMQGMPCDLDGIRKVAREKGLVVIEDACQAVGGRYKGRSLGTIGNAGAFSFNYYKVISAGESGAFITNDPECFEGGYIEQDGGCHLWPDAVGIKRPIFGGNNYRSNEISGAILRQQLKRLPGILSDLRRNRGILRAGICPAHGVRLAASHDEAGDCGVQTLLATKDETQTRRLLELLLARGITAATPLDSGRHIYSNWQCVMEKRGAHHPALDPFRLEANATCRMDYGPKMLPRTLEALGRAVMIFTDVDWTEADALRVVETVNAAIMEIGS